MKIVSRANTWVRPYIPRYLWCHASPHDTKILFILCMVSTAESRHHNELKFYFQSKSHDVGAKHFRVTLLLSIIYKKCFALTRIYWEYWQVTPAVIAQDLPEQGARP
ncbi:hypothetical protein ISS30_07605 [bacterium]|nr:hypothetical protein [bacterium]